MVRPPWPRASVGTGRAAADPEDPAGDRMRIRRCSVKETGVRNGAHGADKFGFKGLKAVHWNLTEPALYEHAIGRGEAQVVQGGALCAETGVHTGRSPKDKFIVCDAGTEKTVWWEKNGKLTPRAVRPAAQRLPRARRGQGAVRPGPLRRGRLEIPDQGARLHRACLALAVHPLAADPARALRARQLRSRFHHPVPALVQGRSQAARRAHRDGGRDQFHQADDPDRRHLLRRRDEEVGVHHAQLLSPGRERDADALLGQRRAGGRRRRCSSASPAPARPRCRPIPTAR